MQLGLKCVTPKYNENLRYLRDVHNYWLNQDFQDRNRNAKRDYFRTEQGAFSPSFESRLSRCIGDLSGRGDMFIAYSPTRKRFMHTPQLTLPGDSRKRVPFFYRNIKKPITEQRPTDKSRHHLPPIPRARCVRPNRLPESYPCNTRRVDTLNPTCIASSVVTVIPLSGTSSSPDGKKDERTLYSVPFGHNNPPMVLMSIIGVKLLLLFEPFFSPLGAVGCDFLQFSHLRSLVIPLIHTPVYDGGFSCIF